MRYRLRTLMILFLAAGPITAWYVVPLSREVYRHWTLTETEIAVEDIAQSHEAYRNALKAGQHKRAWEMHARTHASLFWNDFEGFCDHYSTHGIQGSFRLRDVHVTSATAGHVDGHPAEFPDDPHVVSESYYWVKTKEGWRLNETAHYLW